jgi:hypothetical protein
MGMPRPDMIIFARDWAHNSLIAIEMTLDDQIAPPGLCVYMGGDETVPIGRREVEVGCEVGLFC